MLEKIGAVFESTQQAALIFILRQLQCQIEFRSAAGQRYGRNFQSGQCGKPAAEVLKCNDG